MKKLIEFIKKYKIHILSVLLFIFSFRSCIKTTQIKKLEKSNLNKTLVIDSLSHVVNNQKDAINDISEVIRLEKIKVHVEYDNWISEKNRGEQLMELHKVVKSNIKKLEK